MNLAAGSTADSSASMGFMGEGGFRVTQLPRIPLALTLTREGRGD
jgi:hypothetical protein